MATILYPEDQPPSPSFNQEGPIVTNFDSETDSAVEPAFYEVVVRLPDEDGAEHYNTYSLHESADQTGDTIVRQRSCQQLLIYPEPDEDTSEKGKPFYVRYETQHFTRIKQENGVMTPVCSKQVGTPEISVVSAEKIGLPPNRRCSHQDYKPTILRNELTSDTQVLKERACDQRDQTLQDVPCVSVSIA